jgi:polysaccharide export outer membrane protein
MPFRPAVFSLTLLLAACGSLPRGSGLQREVLAHKDETVKGAVIAEGEAPIPSEFAVEPITKDNLGRYAEWPHLGENALPWIKRVDQPNGQIIAPGDVIAVTIWSTEENSLLGAPGQRLVALPASPLSAEGKMFLPYIGGIKLSGMSPEGARTAIEKAYSAVMPSAQVQLTVTGGRQSAVSMISGVARPGPYPLPDQDVTLLDMIALAGGTAPNIANPQIRLQRGGKTYGVSAHRLMDDPNLNTTLKGGDRVYVEVDERYFLSLGATGTRASHAFPKAKVTAIDALSMIGGLAAERANAQGILILRNYSAKSVRREGSGPRHERTIFTLDLTSADGLFSAGEFQIMTGDLIYVTESPLIGTRNVFGVIGAVFGLAQQVSAAGN